MMDRNGRGAYGASSDQVEGEGGRTGRGRHCLITVEYHGDELQDRAYSGQLKNYLNLGAAC